MSACLEAKCQRGVSAICRRADGDGGDDRDRGPERPGAAAVAIAEARAAAVADRAVGTEADRAPADPSAAGSDHPTIPRATTGRRRHAAAGATAVSCTTINGGHPAAHPAAANSSGSATCPNLDPRGSRSAGGAAGPQVPWNKSVNGNLHVGGTLSKGGGSFKIDHPLDPENKYLSHSFVESPDMMNVYNGNITA